MTCNVVERPNARPQRQAPNRCFSRLAGTASGAASAAGRWLGRAARALLALTVRLVPCVAAALVTVRIALSVPERLLLPERILRLRRESAAVTRPLPLTHQNLTSATLELPPVIVAPLLEFCTASR